MSADALGWLNPPAQPPIACRCGKTIVRLHSGYHPWIHEATNVVWCSIAVESINDLDMAWPVSYCERCGKGGATHWHDPKWCRERDCGGWLCENCAEENATC